MFITLQSFVRTVVDMKRFMSSSPSSQQEMQTLDAVRTERAAIALSSWLELATGDAALAPPSRKRGSVLCSSTSDKFTSSQTVHISPAQLGRVQCSLS